MFHVITDWIAKRLFYSGFPYFQFYHFKCAGVNLLISFILPSPSKGSKRRLLSEVLTTL
jgi:hypothetical protein